MTAMSRSGNGLFFGVRGGGAGGVGGSAGRDALSVGR